jgi:hypothetical protein
MHGQPHIRKNCVPSSKNIKGQSQYFTDITLDVLEENIIGRTKLQQDRGKEF